MSDYRDHKEGDTITIAGLNTRSKRVLVDFTYRGTNGSTSFERDGKFYEFFPFAKEVKVMAKGSKQGRGRKYLTNAVEVKGLVVRDKMTLDMADPTTRLYFSEPQYPVSHGNGFHSPSTFTLRGKRFKEDGSTRTSVDNLTKLIGILGPIIRIEQKGFENDDMVHLIVFWDQGQEYYYIASGFCTGYGGEGPRGLATVATLSGFGTSAECQRKTYFTPRDLKHGVLWQRTAERSRGIQVMTGGVQ